MKIDLDRYRVNIPFIEAMTKAKNEEGRIKEASILAVALHLPIIAVFYYLGELYGFTPELYKEINRLQEFYNVDLVLNIRYSISKK
jgi:hypothetical protein